MPNDPELAEFKAQLEIWTQKAQDHARADSEVDRAFNGALVSLLGTSWKDLPDDAVELYARAKATFDCIEKITQRELHRIEAKRMQKYLDFLMARAGRKS